MGFGGFKSPLKTIRDGIKDPLGGLPGGSKLPQPPGLPGGGGGAVPMPQPNTLPGRFEPKNPAQIGDILNKFAPNQTGPLPSGPASVQPMAPQSDGAPQDAPPRGPVWEHPVLKLPGSQGQGIAGPVGGSWQDSVNQIVNLLGGQQGQQAGQPNLQGLFDMMKRPGGGGSPQVAPQPSNPAPVPGRSQTLSPGIGLDGKRINYR